LELSLLADTFATKRHVEMEAWKIKVKKSLEKYSAYSSGRWKKVYFNERNGGYVVIDKQRMEHAKSSKNEALKLDKELRMSLAFAKSGYQVELLKEIPRIPSPDAMVNGAAAELKKLRSHKNIVRETKDAVGKKGATLVLFEFEAMNSKIHRELNKLKAMGVKAKYFTTANPSAIMDV
jgi:hypothetical protein